MVVVRGRAVDRPAHLQCHGVVASWFLRLSSLLQLPPMHSRSGSSLRMSTSQQKVADRVPDVRCCLSMFKL